MCVATSHNRVGDYIPIKTLGTGSTGKVKLARHINTGHLVALKFIRHDLIHSSIAAYQKVRREIAVLKFIAANALHLQVADKPSADSNIGQRVGVMQLLDVYHYENAVVLVLEYCEGGELFDVLLQHGCLPEHLVLDYFQQITHALNFCHSRGVCHRDLKAENILLTRDGRIKLADFGMATLLKRCNLLHTACGSPQYCAPEVISGERYDGRAADVWSLGVVLFVMTTGGLPFDDDNLPNLIRKIQAAKYFMPAEVPEPIASLIRSMLQPDAAQRASLHEIIRSSWFNSRPFRADVHREAEMGAQQPPPGGGEAGGGRVGAAAVSGGIAGGGRGGRGEPEGECVERCLPITNPDIAVLKHLADLGLGDLSTIRRRLASGVPCREREYFCLLQAFCRNLRTYVPPVAAETDAAVTALEVDDAHKWLPPRVDSPVSVTGTQSV